MPDFLDNVKCPITFAQFLGGPTGMPSIGPTGNKVYNLTGFPLLGNSAFKGTCNISGENPPFKSVRANMDYKRILILGTTSAPYAFLVVNLSGTTQTVPTGTHAASGTTKFDITLKAGEAALLNFVVIGSGDSQTIYECNYTMLTLNSI